MACFLKANPSCLHLGALSSKSVHSKEAERRKRKKSEKPPWAFLVVRGSSKTRGLAGHHAPLWDGTSVDYLLVFFFFMNGDFFSSNIKFKTANSSPFTVCRVPGSQRRCKDARVGKEKRKKDLEMFTVSIRDAFLKCTTA